MIDVENGWNERLVTRYRELLVPTLFHPWACLLVEALGPPSGGHALDIGTGPGTVARVLAARLGPEGSVVAIDASPAMLKLARRRPPMPGAAPIRYMNLDATAIDIPEGSCNAVACQQVLQFVSDPYAVLREVNRVAAPCSPVAVVVWAELKNNPMFAAIEAALDEVLGPEVAAAYAQPWTVGPAHVARVMEAAGLTGITVQRRALPFILPGGTDAACDTLECSGWADTIATLPPAKRSALRTAIHDRLVPYVDGNQLETITTATLVLARTRADSA